VRNRLMGSLLWLFLIVIVAWVIAFSGKFAEFTGFGRILFFFSLIAFLGIFVFGIVRRV
jgi:hypothetical protein